MTPPSVSYAPGARIVVRDAEWVVRRVDTVGRHHHRALSVVGVSELVRNREAVFLTEIERDIRILDPADAKLVRDESPTHRAARLHIESLLREAPPTDDLLHIGHHAVMDHAPYQWGPAIQALGRPRARILIADAVGLGKTLEAGVLLAELIRRGRGRRILVVTVKSMLTQFQKELWSRFTIPLTRLDSIGVQRIRSLLPADHNPFHYFDRSIISVDTLKQDAQYRTYLEQAEWDVIVLDEAQNVAERGKSRSLRARLAQLLSERSDTLVMLSATPHDGSAKSFASLMNMLDPTAVASPEDYGPEDIKGLFIRRFKKDIGHQVASSFQERRSIPRKVHASPEEERAYDLLSGIAFRTDGPRRSGAMLFKTVLVKSLFSSPAACLETIGHRIGVLGRKPSPAHDADIEALERLGEAVSRIGTRNFSKYGELLRALGPGNPDGAWNPRDPADRVTIFTERIETLRFLRENLPADLGLPSHYFATLHGAMSDIEQQRAVEEFGRDDAVVRALIASDVASEGINLHFLCHRLIHFDIPWSLMVFQQRNGRIDRFGQERVPEITYLLTMSDTPEIQGDARILEVLVRKDEQAMKNIGDPAALMGLYDIQAEELCTAEAMESGEGAPNFERRLSKEPENLDLLALLMGEEGEPGAIDPTDRTARGPSLFTSDFEYAKAAVAHLRTENGLHGEWDDANSRIEIHAAEDLLDRFKRLPKEIMPVDGVFTLTADKAEMARAIRRSRTEETAWPSLHFLWPLHPVMEWLNDKALASFGRHECPVIFLEGVLPPEETVFLIFGVLFNLKSHALIHEKLAVVFERECLARIESIDAFIGRTSFGARPYPNNLARSCDLEAPTRLLPHAVREARGRMSVALHDFRARMNPLLDERVNELTRWHERRLELIGERYRGEGAVAVRRKDEEAAVKKIFDEYATWVEESMTLEDEPFLRPAAVFTG